MGQFEQSTQDNDGCAPTVGVLHKHLPERGIHPLLHFSDNIHGFLLFFLVYFLRTDVVAGNLVCLSMPSLTMVRTQRKPM